MRLSRLLVFALSLLVPLMLTSQAERPDCVFRGTLNNSEVRSSKCKIISDVLNPYLTMSMKYAGRKYDLELSGIKNIKSGKYEIVLMTNLGGRFDRNVGKFRAIATQTGERVRIRASDIVLMARRDTYVRLNGVFSWVDITPKRNICFACDCYD